MIKQKKHANGPLTSPVGKKIVAVYIPNVFWDQDFCIPQSCNVMGSQILVEPPMTQTNPGARSNIIEISNVPERYPWDDFHRLLIGFGNIQHFEKGPTKTDNTYCIFVTYDNPGQAQEAQLQLDNFEIQAGFFLKVEFVMNQSRGRGARGARSTRFFVYPSANQPPVSQADFPLRILVLSDMVGAIIGRAGGTIRQITQQSRARVDVHRKENAGSPEKVITIYGNPPNCSTACHKILEVMQQEAAKQGSMDLPLKILAHNNLIGRIIGKNGSTIKRIMEQTETKIAVSSSIHDTTSFTLERVITVKGKVENLTKAEQMISAKLRQSYENDLAAMAPQAVMFPGLHPMAMMSTIGAQQSFPVHHPRGASPPILPPFNVYNPSPYMIYPNAMPLVTELQKETVFVFIPNTAVGAVIGTGGCSIREMISASSAIIKVAQPGKEDEEKDDERKVTVIGTPEAQWKAQYMIFKKVKFDYNLSSDPNLKIEILVPADHVGRIIGRGGQTVRELQRLTHATIKFPSNTEITENEELPVQITGDFYSSQAAQRQIRALIYKNIMTDQRQRGTPSPIQQTLHLQPVQN